MKKFLIFISYLIFIAIIVFLFESIMSGSFCKCQKVYCPSTFEDQLKPRLTMKGDFMLKYG